MTAYKLTLNSSFPGYVPLIQKLRASLVQILKGAPNNMMDMSLSRLQELVMDREAWLCCSPWGPKELDMTERLN